MNTDNTETRAFVSDDPRSTADLEIPGDSLVPEGGVEKFIHQDFFNSTTTECIPISHPCS